MCFDLDLSVFYSLLLVKLLSASQHRHGKCNTTKNVSDLKKQML